MEPVQITLVALVVVAFGLVSMRIERWPVTMPMVFVAFGVIAAETGMIEIGAELEAVAVLAEITLGVILFSDAACIDLRRLRAVLAIPARLLGIGLPLTIVAGAIINKLLFPYLPLAEVALVAAVLAPTDAALGSAVVADEAVPLRQRLALSVESGVNDGLVVPAVTIFTAAVLDEGRSTASWFGFIVRQVGGGIALGLMVGIAGVSLLRRAHHRNWSDGRYEQLVTFMLPIIALFSATALEANSFIAAFVAGLAFGSFGDDRSHTESAESAPDQDSAHAALFGEFTVDAAQLLELGAFFVFGNVLLIRVFDDVSWRVLSSAALILTVGRMLPVWLALIGTGTRWQTKIFVGWFGPRGLASVIFGLLLLEELGEIPGRAEELFGVIGITVAASVVLHGASAAWGARRYGRWAEESPMSPEDREEMMMPDSDVATMLRPRWAREPRS